MTTVPELVMSNGWQPLSTSLRRRWWRDWGNVTIVAVGAVVSALVLGVGIGGLGSGELSRLSRDATSLLGLTVTVVLAVRLLLLRSLPAKARRAWLILTLGFAGQAAYYLAFFVQITVRDGTLNPIWSAVYIVSNAAWLVGLLAFPGPRQRRGDRLKFGLDILITMIGATIANWYLVLGPRLGDASWSSPLAVIDSFSTIAGPLLVVFGLCALLVRGVAPVSRRAIQLMAIGMALVIFSDVFYTFLFPHVIGFLKQVGLARVPGMSVAVGAFFFAMSANQQYQRARQGIPDDELAPMPTRSRNRVPYIAVVAAYALLLFAARNIGILPLGGMIIGAVLLTGVVLMRQIVAALENRRLATTDSLTGIANRAMLTDHLEDAVERARATGRAVVVMMLDLNRFKPVNDTLGHHAGDAVLISVARSLQSVVRRRDSVVGRLGGDEFAVIVTGLAPTDAADQAAAIGARILTAINQPIPYDNELLNIGASIGATVGAGTTTADELLRRADVAMYVSKRTPDRPYTLYATDMEQNDRRGYAWIR